MVPLFLPHPLLSANSGGSRLKIHPDATPVPVSIAMTLLGLPPSPHLHPCPHGGSLSPTTEARLGVPLLCHTLPRAHFPLRGRWRQLCRLYLPPLQPHCLVWLGAAWNLSPQISVCHTLQALLQCHLPRRASPDRCCSCPHLPGILLPSYIFVCSTY